MMVLSFGSRSLLILGFIVCNSVSAPAATRHVPGEYATLQSAIDAATAGDTIVVATGMYYENLQIDKDIVLRSGNPLNPAVVAATIIDGASRNPVVRFTGHESPRCILEGFTLRHGRGREDYSASICAGGGIWGGHSKATIRHNVITGNAAPTLDYPDAPTLDGRGGGLYQCDGLIEHNVISGNASSWNGTALDRCGGTIRENLISDNYALVDMLPHVPYSSFTYVLNECDGTILGNTIERNVTGRTTIRCGGSLIVGNLIRDNSSEEGAVSVAPGARLVNNLIIGNTCESASVVQTSGDFIHNTVVGNTVGSPWNAAVSAPRVVNSIIWDNSCAGPILEGTPAFSCIQAWAGGGEGNIATDPRFIAPESGGYSLRPDSPCIDNGTDQPSVNSDASGRLRPVGRGWDMGALEADTLLSVPARPQNLLPPPGTVVVRSVLLQTSPFVGAGTTTHAASFWLVDDETQFGSPRFSVFNTPTLLTQLMLSGLRHGTRYFWRVAYRDSEGVWSPWSQPTHFDTLWVPELHVPSELPTIQAAVECASAGMHVVVAPGTYIENVSMPGLDFTLRSTDPSDPAVVAGTVIDAATRGPAISFTGEESPACLLSGLTLIHGKSMGDGQPPYLEGGGISGHSTHATVRGNQLRWNDCGAANCSGLIEDNLVADNGYLGVFGAGLRACDGMIRGNTITRNLAAESSGLLNCSIIEGNWITDNTAGGNGGAVFTFTNNIVFRNNLVARNCSRETGYRDGSVLNAPHVVFANNTVVDNQEGFFLESYSSQSPTSGPSGKIQFYNNIVWKQGLVRASFNSNVIKDPTGYVNGYSIVQGRTAHTDPGFIAPASGDYHLRPDSPAVDAGTPVADLLTDLDGRPRPFGAGYDIGAYEYFTTPTPTPTPSPTPSPTPTATPLPKRLYVDAAVGQSGDGLSWDRAKKTIWEALALAIAGDEVWVAEGAYWETAVIPSGVAVYGGFDRSESSPAERDLAAHPTVLRAQGSSVVYLGRVSGCRLDGFTLTGGCASGPFLTLPPYRNEGGGGIYCDTADDTNVIANCTIFDNTASYLTTDYIEFSAGGGGMMFVNASPRVLDCTIRDNYAGESGYHEPWTNVVGAGGGIFCASDAAPTFERCVIEDNRALGIGYGGGIFADDTNRFVSPVFRDCVIRGNYAEWDAGGAWGGIFINCTISGNRAEYRYGAVAAYELVNCLVDNNRGLFEVLSVGDCINSTLVGNQARYIAKVWQGGRVINCVFADNQGAAVSPYRTAIGGVEVAHCLFRNNSDGELYVPINDNQGYVLRGAEAINAATEVVGIGNREGDPMFINAAATPPDLHLRPDSACIDAGTSTAAPADDRDGRPRPFGAGCDIGAYEYDGTYPTPTPTATFTPTPRATETSTPTPTETWTPTPSETPSPSRFDLNRDGRVDASDLVLLRECAESGDPAADFNRDGCVDAADILMFARYWEGTSP